MVDSTSRRIAVALALSLALGISIANAGTDTEVLTITATVGDHAKLVIAPTTINFPDADPDAVDPIPASENAVIVEAKVRTSSSGVSTLTCLANGDLEDGGNTIDINNVTWTALGAGFVDGTMSDVSDQAVGSWTGSGMYQGTFDYFLANSWFYETGNYSQTVTYTLVAP